jgi:D-cysteine desulfhydrase
LNSFATLFVQIDPLTVRIRLANIIVDGCLHYHILLSIVRCFRYHILCFCVYYFVLSFRSFLPIFNRNKTELNGKVAWADLQAQFPTPVHEANVTLDNGKSRKIYLKREDLSSNMYGGNKVRTLEHLMGCAASEIRRRFPDGRRGKIITIGGPGSNQSVALTTYGQYVVEELDPGCLMTMPEGTHVCLLHFSD